MSNEEMLKQDLERAVKELELDGSNTKQKVKYLLEECLDVYFKPKKYLTYDDIIKLPTYKKINEDEKIIYYKVKLNDHIYRMTVHHYANTWTGDWSEIVLTNFKYKKMMATTIDENNKEFVNDLHLELLGKE